ncbi:MAG: hypothetical protein IKG80_01455 [Clostridia bacterium]|nr:hypothetical protein [Clostridia bacterium]
MGYNFSFISKHHPKVELVHRNLIRLLNSVRIDLRTEYSFKHEIIGSYARDMMTYDPKSNVGFDLDVNIEPHDVDQYSPKKIKLLFKESLDKISNQYGFDYAEDSTRVLTIKVKDRINSKILYSIDFAFIKYYVDSDGIKRQEYIHFDKKQNSYGWRNQSQGFYRLAEKEKRLMKDYKNELRNAYLDKKNNNTDPNKHSRSLYAEAVKECYQRYK